MSSDKSFGIFFFIFFFIISLLPLFNNGNINIWFLSLAIIFLLLSFVMPVLLSPFNIIWTKFGIYLGKIISPIIMMFIYLIIVTPIGIIMRLLKKDILDLNFNKNKSYWIERSSKKTNMKKQF